jgi:hypothetical protein
MSLQVGQLVYVMGLVQAHQHNGKVGIIQKALDPSSGRCVVMLDDRKTIINIKPANLQVADSWSAWRSIEEERVRLNPPPPLWDEVYDRQSLVWRHPGMIWMILSDW